MPWEKQYNQADVIEQAMRTFWAHGYEGTSIGDLVAATGINRGSLYSAFDGKRSLYIAALEHFDRVYRSEFLAELAEKYPPRDAIVVAFETAARSDGSDGDPGGCFLVNTALELSPHDPDIAALVQVSFAEVEDFFARMIDRAKQSGSMASTTPTQATAKALLGLFLGLRVMARARADEVTRAAITTQASSMLV